MVAPAKESVLVEVEATVTTNGICWAATARLSSSKHINIVSLFIMTGTVKKKHNFSSRKVVQRQYKKIKVLLFFLGK